MSLLDWLLPRSKASNPLVSPTAAALEALHQQPAAHPPVVDNDLKARRQERRERIYAVVREAMLRSEVLASRYKFKVLSLDTHGRQFLIMIDLMDGSAVAPDRFASIEQQIIGHAAQQHGIYVKSVYWRSTDSVLPVAAPTPEVAAVVAKAPTAPAAQPVLVVELSKTAAHAPTPAAQVLKPALRPAFDPIDQDEVMAFKKAIGAIPAAPASNTPGQVRTSGSRHVMTGFEDTQILETTEDAGSPLSRTQFGELL